MIITRSPLRISLGGGGTDLPSYYEEHGGFLIAAAIDKYVYITLHRTFVHELIVKYSKLERVKSVDELEHPIIREALKLRRCGCAHIWNSTSMADIPAGTGLGSSGSFTTALLKALHAYRKNIVRPGGDRGAGLRDRDREAATSRSASRTSTSRRSAASPRFIFSRAARSRSCRVKIDEETLFNLEDNLLLFFTGYTRSASAILKEQNDRTKSLDRAMVDNLHFVKELGLQSKEALESGDLREFARLMDVHWQRKKERSGGMSNPQINEWYDLAMANGALGGKLIGAGGGGFLMFLRRGQERVCGMRCGRPA